MTHPRLSTSDMSSANYGIPTPPANDNSDTKNPFFPNSDISSVKEGEKKKDLVETTVIHDSTDASSEHSMPSTPEPSNQSQLIQSQSKVRFLITDPSMVPILVARIAETNNVKLPDTSSTPLHSGNYGDLSVSTAPSVCESVSSIPDLSDSASSPVSSPHEEDSSNDSSGSSTDQSRSVTSNVMSAVPCATSTTTPTVVTSSTAPVLDVSNTTTTTTTANASYSVRVLQKIANSSTDASSSSSSSSSNSVVDNSKTTTTSDQVTNNDENVTSTSKVTIANAIVAASAAPRTVVYHDRSARRSKRKGIPYKSPSHDDLLREPGFVFSFPVLFNNVLPIKHSVSDKSNQDETSKETSSCEMEQGTSTVFPNNNNESNNVINTSSESHSTSKSKDTSINNELQSAKIIHRPLLLPDIVRSLSQARRSKMRTRPVTRAKNRRENEELDMFNLGIEHMIDSQNSNAAAIEEAKARKRRIATVGRPSKKSILPSSSSQVPRSSNSGENKPPRGSSICSTSSSSSAAAFYRIPSKRRDSMSVSSLSSIPPSELSDFDLNSDNFGDDEDDPDFAPPAKKRKSEVPRGSKTVGRKESNSKVKVCASCRTKSTPCWRPGWSTDLMLCNSCGLRYKKTKCVCINPECRYIPLKSEYNAMFKKPKNGDTPDLKRCCKCQTPL